MVDALKILYEFLPFSRVCFSYEKLFDVIVFQRVLLFVWFSD